jgi:hypothetical protein
MTVAAMRANPARTLALAFILLAFGMLGFAMAIGGDILMIVLGLLLAAISMQLFRHANPGKEDE